MNILGSLLGLWNRAKYNIVHRWGVAMQSLEENGVTGQPEKIAIVFTCCKILSDNLSRMPLSVWVDNDSGKVELKRHRLTYLIKTKPNSYQNAQQFWSTVEYHRSEF